MSDFISREAAILEIQRYGVGCLDPDEFTPEQAERFVIARFQAIPAADVRPVVRGEWETVSVPKPQTNADRIRAMTDEELAEFLDRWEMGDIDYSKSFCDLCKGQLDCYNDCLMGWLKQEATNA